VIQAAVMRVTFASEWPSSAAALHAGAIHEVRHRAYVGIEQFSGEGCSTIAPHDSMSRGRFRLAQVHRVCITSMYTIEKKWDGGEGGRS
jgi:hypothetical protein